MAAGVPVPVLWICGPAGVGKSTASWRLYTELARSGVPVAFLDSDQLGMCYPAPAGDPRRQHVKAQNVGSMISNFRSAGAQRVIVNGALGPAGLETGLLPDARVTICRLRASAGDVERRLTARHGGRDGTGELLREVRDEINYRAAGATHLVATGMIASQADLQLYAAELPGTDAALIRLRADSGELRRRIMSRGAGGSWPEPGDRLRGQPAEFLAWVAGQAVQAAEASDRPDAGGVRVDTTGRSPDESAGLIRDALGWP